MRKKILLIENDDAVRELILLVLQQDGYEVATVAPGLHAYDTALFMKPDLIITDINMPRTDSIDLLRRMRQQPALEQTPVLVTTAFGTGSATFSLQHGASAFEPKPIDAQSFRSTVRRLLTDNSKTTG
jgi:CheY-like chemotaxis protein